MEEVNTEDKDCNCKKLISREICYYIKINEIKKDIKVKRELVLNG